MKTTLAISLLFCLLACHKKDDPCEKPTGLAGEWIWVESVGGIGGWTETPATEHQTKTLKIDDYYFREYVNDTLAFESQYDLGISDEVLVGTEARTYIEFTPSGELKAIVTSDTELLLYDQCIDCFTHRYKRK